MFTVCPKCALTLVVTAADLRVAQGYVRCGRCSSVFNALARLSDERRAEAQAEESAPASGAEPAEPGQAGADLSPLEEALSQPHEDEGSEAIPEAALEFNPETTDVRAVFVEPPPNPQWTAATGSFKAMRAASQVPEPAGKPGESQVDVEIDAALLGDMLGEAPESDTRHEPQASEPQPTDLQRAEARAPETADSALKPDTGTSAGPGAAGVGVRPAARHASPHTRPPAQASHRPRESSAHQPRPRAHQAPPLRRTAQAVADPIENAPGDSGASENTPEAKASSEKAPNENAHNENAAVEIVARKSATTAVLASVDARAWGAGAALALLLLLAQIVNHNRDELAANPRFGRPLTALYGSLGVQLMPHWDLRAYDVRQLGASADPRGNGLITVRASVKNAGRQAQPLPLLRVTLQDRFGNRIAARDVAPHFYVPRTVPDSSYLAGGQRIDAEMGFVDPGANAVGFEIDACLPARGGGVTCANDLTAR
ncbi:MAG: DUF3426 domain-containing protein [Gammaproteobacteria bacterium]|nr:DUF3426 domain-containing protein [Gammaproteobacteria bacterium]